MHQALYRKWRPKTFADVMGQDHITSVLKSEVSSGKITHAYIFCGPRGTGKTTGAKIISRAVNCESPVGGNPCGKCAACRGVPFHPLHGDYPCHGGNDDCRGGCDLLSSFELNEKSRSFSFAERDRDFYI